MATGLTLLLHVSFLTSTLLLYGMPAFYLSLRTKEGIFRAAFFSSIFTFFAGIIIDHLAIANKSWVTESIFTYRVGGKIPLEDFLWIFLLIYLIVIFYEHFLDKGRHKKIDSHLKYLIMFFVLLFTVFLLILSLSPHLILIPYFYFWMGFLGMAVPIGIFFILFPHKTRSLFIVAPYFIALAFLNEFTALILGHWTFPGNQFIGWIHLGNVSFPLEELLFFIILFSSAITAYFEFFDDAIHLK